MAMRSSLPLAALLALSACGSFGDLAPSRRFRQCGACSLTAASQRIMPNPKNQLIS